MPLCADKKNTPAACHASGVFSCPSMVLLRRRRCRIAQTVQPSIHPAAGAAPSRSRIRYPSASHPSARSMPIPHARAAAATAADGIARIYHRRDTWHRRSCRQKAGITGTYKASDESSPAGISHGTISSQQRTKNASVKQKSRHTASSTHSVLFFMSVPTFPVFQTRRSRPSDKIRAVREKSSLQKSTDMLI